MRKHVFHCDSCKRNLVHTEKYTTGYGIDPDTKHRYCFRCCGDMDRDAMAECKPGDKFTLYLSFERDIVCNWKRLRYRAGEVSNWPGTLKFKTGSVKRGGHNIAGVRYDVWFRDHTGAWWWGVQYGNWTQICHCRKLKPEA